MKTQPICLRVEALRGRGKLRIAAWILAASVGACSATPTVRTPRELRSGAHSGLTIPLQRAFQTQEEYERFATALGAKGEMPKSLEAVRWGDETVLVIFAGEVPEGERPSVERVSELGDALVVTWRVSSKRPDRVFADDPPPLPEFLGERKRATPFVVIAVPAYDGKIRFLQAKGLLE